VPERHDGLSFTGKIPSSAQPALLLAADPILLAHRFSAIRHAA